MAYSFAIVVAQSQGPSLMLPFHRLPGERRPALVTVRTIMVSLTVVAVAACTPGADDLVSSDVGTAEGDAPSSAQDDAASITVAGLEPDTVLNAETTPTTTVEITAAVAPDEITVTINDQPVPDAAPSPSASPASSAPASSAPAPSVSQAPSTAPTDSSDAENTDAGSTTVTITGEQIVTLGDGRHELVVTAGADTVLRNPSTLARSFTIDMTIPELILPDSIESNGLTDPLEVEFTTSGATSVTAADAEVTFADDAGTAIWAQSPTEVTVVAADDAGNEVTSSAPVVVTHPGMRAVHTTPFAWEYQPKREAVIDLIEAGLIDTVQLDVKDESGNIGFDSQVELANHTGADATHANFDAQAAVQQLHDLGVRVVGRLVVYKDPVLAQWAWGNDNRDWVTQTTDGQPFTGSYGEFAFTNPANPDVQQYNVDIALEAAALGFDEILYDYIRRPDGSLDAMVFPGIGDRTPEQAVVEVMATAYPLLHEQGVWVGASVFGIAVDRPLEIAQDIPAIAPYVDYVAPMVYPDHWGAGEYDLASPVDAPYEIVQRSLADFNEMLEPTGTEVIPWLAAFKVSGDTSVDYVRKQIDATVDATGNEWFLLWNPGANYVAATMNPIGPDGP